MNLALGTVQFGMLYGLARNERLANDEEVREILELAFAHGITILDTAPAYGNIESRLGELCDDLEFKIISKIPPLPKQLNVADASRWALESAQASFARLGHRLYALLFHRAEDLLDDRGEAILHAIVTWASARNILIGASGYEINSVRPLFTKRCISIAQLPGNALDQRIGSALENMDWLPELHLRSAFLQGLLLLPFGEAIKRVPAAAKSLRQWHEWVERNGLTPLRAALSIVKAFENVRACVVGVDNIKQLEDLLVAWHDARPIRAAELASDDQHSVDPRQWR